LENTKNPHEYLRVARVLAGETANGFSEAAGLGKNGMQDVETGVRLPGSDLYAALQAALSEKYPDFNAERFEELVINARVDMIIGSEEKAGSRSSAGKQFQNMPEAFYKEQVAQLLGKSSGDVDGKPIWIKDKMPKIESKGNYIRALRHALGLSTKKLAEESDMSKPLMLHIENGESVSTVTLTKIADHLDSKRDQLGALWDREVFEALPSLRAQGQGGSSHLDQVVASKGGVKPGNGAAAEQVRASQAAAATDGGIC
jgi:transcriptional regulator with XRE-family HTH domain